jgi:hypothetical protein
VTLETEVLWFIYLAGDSLPLVYGKHASVGELLSAWSILEYTDKDEYFPLL